MIHRLGFVALIALLWACDEKPDSSPPAPSAESLATAATTETNEVLAREPPIGALAKPVDSATIPAEPAGGKLRGEAYDVKAVALDPKCSGDWTVKLYDSSPKEGFGLLGHASEREVWVGPLPALKAATVVAWRAADDIWFREVDRPSIDLPAVGGSALTAEKPSNADLYLEVTEWKRADKPEDDGSQGSAKIKLSIRVGPDGEKGARIQGTYEATIMTAGVCP